ncbi:MAG: TIGR00730 family Rossman fold protein [Promethearchaeota archaeon]
MNKRSITVYCASSDAVASDYFKVAENLAKEMIKHHFHLIYGGADVGLMGRIASTVKSLGGKITAVIPRLIYENTPQLEDYDELIITETMGERKKIMEDRGDAFIAMPGGFGTLEEIIEVITLKQLHYHNKPIVFLNIDGFYNALFEHFENLFQNAFAKPDYRKLYYSARTPQEAVEYIMNYKPVKLMSKWYDTKNGYSSTSN